jgi:hypothetical protein
LRNQARLSLLCFLRNLYAGFATLVVVPRFTDDRVRQLCSQAIACKTQADIEKVIKELRDALGEHIRLARENLKIQATTIRLITSAKQHGKNGKPPSSPVHTRKK